MNKDHPRAAAHEHLHLVDVQELQPQAATGAPLLGGRLGLFGGVKARVTAVVGGAETSIGDLLALRAGEMLALDRRVDMPIDLCVEGRVIARGQLSVLGEQFAVRVTEVVDGGAA
ncbi:FliM/FliN family flagellar motor switch protein [Methylibium rhizosphaerae]|uniref:FliM/FliN family flagellar motor switch protein n=1 Tax=Methylibium rhizosphaerae TaxID=2570323 RepID=UPI00112B5EEC|nr:FliM/FliN family flagellar motor switch protein [Methylibium rhizosphaerae]